MSIAYWEFGTEYSVLCTGYGVFPFQYWVFNIQYSILSIQSSVLNIHNSRSRVSKRNLKPSGTQIFRPKGPCGHIKGAILQKKYNFRKNVKNQFWPVLKYVKKYAEFNGAIRFGWNLLKWWVFDDFHFYLFGPNFCQTEPTEPTEKMSKINFDRC